MFKAIESSIHLHFEENQCSDYEFKNNTMNRIHFALQWYGVVVLTCLFVCLFVCLLSTITRNINYPIPRKPHNCTYLQYLQS